MPELPWGCAGIPAVQMKEPDIGSPIMYLVQLVVVGTLQVYDPYAIVATIRETAITAFRIRRGSGVFIGHFSVRVCTVMLFVITSADAKNKKRQYDQSAHSNIEEAPPGSQVCDFPIDDSAVH